MQIPFNIPPLNTDGIATFISYLIQPKQYISANFKEFNKNYYEEFKNKLPQKTYNATYCKGKYKSETNKTYP
ncbi:hypothetical protein [Sporomusa termitida]|uniref:hypothetical protein n=1 Tax=Sporomusa termitida TaxID=2377 RepID=UPI003CCC6C72